MPCRPDPLDPVTGSLGLRGRRHRKKAIGMLLAQANAAMGATPRTGGGRVAAWAMSQAVPMLLRKADGRVLVWVWKDDPELVVALAQVQQATPQLRAARAMMPMEYDDTEDFRTPSWARVRSSRCRFRRRGRSARADAAASLRRTSPTRGTRATPSSR